ncbi:MAG: hypothetical protein ACOVOV_00915 [Dolichospermum sp.]
MKVDRCYLLLGQFNRHSQSGDGSDFWDIDLREILQGLYDKYNRFNLKLEAYHSRTATSANLPNEIQFLQVRGYNWLSGLDTNPTFANSRVAGVMFLEHTGSNEFMRGILYPSNIGTMTFSKQANPRIRMELFSTDPDLTTKVNPFFGNENPNFLFSFTGVEDKYPIYREPEVIEKSGQLTLNTANAIYLDTNRLANRWRVDLSQLIDRNIYQKYSKFALITKMIQQNNIQISFSAWSGVTFMMSGFNWYSPSLKLNSTYTGNRAWLVQHQGAPTAIGLIESNNSDITKETFIDNVFFKPSSPVVEVTLTFNRLGDMAFTGVTAPVPPFYFIFNIVPVDD